MRVGCCGQLRPVPVAGGRKAPPRNDQTEHFRAEPGHFAMSARFAQFVSTRSRTFVGRDMIAKLFRPMRMNILLHKKCFRDHRSRVSFGVTPPGRATPKAAVLPVARCLKFRHCPGNVPSIGVLRPAPGARFICVAGVSNESEVVHGAQWVCRELNVAPKRPCNWDRFCVTSGEIAL